MLEATAYCNGETTDQSKVRVTLPKGDVERTMMKFGMERKGELLGEDIAILTKFDDDGEEMTVEVYFLIDLKANCVLGPTAEKGNKDVVGIFLELNMDTGCLETEENDNYVTCYCHPAAMRKCKRLFGMNKLNCNHAFYSHNTGKAYIGYRIQ